MENSRHFPIAQYYSTGTNIFQYSRSGVSTIQQFFKQQLRIGENRFVATRVQGQLLGILTVFSLIS